MGATYELINVTKKERLMYLGLPVSTAREITGNRVSATITSWYMLQNQGDVIGFVSDYDNSWPLPKGSREEAQEYNEITEEVISSLVKTEILEDLGTKTIDGDPELLERVLKVIW